MSALLGIPPGPGSGRRRYGRAMALYAAGALSPAELEAYRVAAADDAQGPDGVFADRGLKPPNPDLGPALAAETTHGKDAT